MDDAVVSRFGNLKIVRPNNVYYLWNTVDKNRGNLFKVCLGDEVLIVGGDIEHSGVLEIRQIRSTELRVKLTTMGRAFEEAVPSKEEIKIFLRGIEITVHIFSVVPDSYIFVSFELPPSANVLVEIKKLGSTISSISTGPEAA